MEHNSNNKRNNIKRNIAIMTIAFCLITQLAAASLIYNPINRHYYELISDNLDWQTAKTQAETHFYQNVQAHLATITSQSEQNFIENNVPITSGTWLGGFQPENSPEPAGNWQWVTGENWSYSNWLNGEPNNAGNEDCLTIYSDGGWNDVPESWARPYLIEYDTPEPITFLFLLIGSLIFITPHRP